MRLTGARGSMSDGTNTDRRVTVSIFSAQQALLQMGRPKKSKEFCRFRCTICNAASSRKFNLQRHVNSHHPNVTNCIIDLTPPKNPRQMRLKNEDGGGPSMPPGLDIAMYNMLMPEGVCIDGAMDLSVNTSPEKAGGSDDDETSIADSNDDLTPITSMAVVAGTGTNMAIAPQRASTPDDTMAAGALNMAANQAPGNNAEKRFAKNKKSLDNMLLNKFGNFYNFPGQGEHPSTDMTSETEMGSKADDVAEQTENDAEESMHDDLVIDEADSDDVSRNDATLSEEKPAVRADDSEEAQDGDSRHDGDENTSMETDTNANNKNSLVVTNSSKFSPDVNGNSKSAANIAAAASRSQTAIPKYDVTEQVSSLDDHLSSGSSNTCEQLNMSAKADNLNKISDMDNTLDYADKLEIASRDDNKASSLINTGDESDAQSQDALNLSDVTGIDSVENMSDVNTSTESGSTSSPRKASSSQVAKSALHREPIKTRTTTRASSISTRRSSTLREEVEAQ